MAVWDGWIPGVLAPDQVKKLITKGYIQDAGGSDAIDGSSIDLHISDKAWELPAGSVKPFGNPFEFSLSQAELIEELSSDGGIYKLEARKTYLFKIRESLWGLDEASISGQATARSSIGRVDVLARLVVDGTTRYEGFDLGDLSDGKVEMFLEVTPMTFPVRVQAGQSLSQLRFFFADPARAEIKGKELCRTCFNDPKKVRPTLSVDLSDDYVHGHPVVAFEATRSKDHPPVDLWKDSPDIPSPKSYWQFRQADDHGRLRIEKGKFYILRSKETLALPGGVSVYARATNEEIGEMRIHYAGFVHPGFGRNREDGKIGTPLIFEVRGHGVDVNLRDGETMAYLQFYRMAEDVPKDQWGKSPYEDQTLQLSDFFADWPKSIDVDDNGVVTVKE